MNYIVQILRTLFFTIDRVIYDGIGTVYDLLLRISRTTIIDSSTINTFYTRIYALIGIFMLFKISLSLITYVLNPDEFIDKEKGFASIVKRIIISLVMLVLVPYGFKEAYALQAMLLEDNTLAALVFGEINNNSIDTAGEKMKFILMYTFFQPNYNGLYNSDGNVDLASCAVTYEYESDGKVVESPENSGVFKLNPDCFGEKTDDLYPDDSAFGNYWKDTNAKNASDLYQTYAQGIARQNFYLMFKHDIAMIEKDGEKGLYLIDYKFPLSTAIGVAVLWVLLMFCVDVAVRSLKLAFFQLIAPIPILSYIDPKSKDGMFSKWIRQCGTTYASLFLRLLALYLAIFIISKVSSTGIQDVITGERITDLPVCIFVIIGVLIFAKQLPKILEDALGFKGTGDFTLNPLKKMDSMLGASAIKRVGGTAAAVGVAGGLALGANAITGFTTNKGLGRLKGITSGLAGAGSAMGRAALGGLRGEKFGKNWASSYGAAMQAKQNRADRHDDNVGWAEMMVSKAQQKMGVHTAGEKAKVTTDDFKKLTELRDEATTIADKSDSTVKRLLREKEAYSGWDAASSVDKDRFYTTRTRYNAETNQMETYRHFDSESYNDAVKEALAKKAEQMRQYDDDIDAARSAYFQSQGSDTAIGQIYSQMQDIMKKHAGEIESALGSTSAKARGIDGKVEYVKDQNGNYVTDANGNRVEQMLLDSIRDASGNIDFSKIGISQIKEVGTAGISARQTYEQSGATRHAQDVDKYARNSKNS